MKRHRFLLVVTAGLLFCEVFSASSEQSLLAQSSLPVVSGDYPRVFFFRQSEGLARQGRLSFDAWEKAFSRLMGIEGKVLDEEVPGTSANNIEFFVNFKRRYPDQLVLLHFNGNARDPRFETEEYFAGHWIYHVGSKILSDVPAEEGTTEIKVEDPSCYLTGIGRYRNSNDDIGLCELDDSGRPDWNRSEQVQLLAVNRDKGTILVKRGCYGTKPRSFAAGRAYAAAHATEGPWGRNSHLLWYYNYATCCPKDKNGRTCSDILVAELGRRFGPGGELALFDGLEFDVLHHSPRAGRRPVDCDADGKADGGVIEGVNVYGIGVIRFLEALRARLGEDKLILADGQLDARTQRGFGLVNGIESEGFPWLRDWEMKQWSTGINRHNFWAQFGRPPVFNYINHKYVRPGTQPGVEATPDVPFSIHRLVFAAAVMTDAAICYSFSPPKDPSSVIGVWDEFWAGQERRLGWLGRPLAPTQTLATQAPDLLAPVLNQLKQKNANFGVLGARTRWEESGFVVEADEEGKDVVFEIPITISAREAYIECVASAQPRRGYPENMARYATCSLVPTETQDTRTLVGSVGEQGTWVGRKPFSAGFYFPELKPGNYHLRLRVEGAEPVRVERLALYPAADARYRVFQHGLVLANPSLHEVSYDLRTIAPGRKFRRIKGSPEQDPVTNNGAAVGDMVVLPAKDALFLMAE